MEKSRHGAFVYAQKVLKHSLFLFLLINLLSISPDISASTTLLEQKYTLNLSFKDARLEQVLDAIMKQSGVKIAYSSDELQKDRVVSVDIQTSDILTALRSVLGDGYSFKQIEDYIAIARKETSDSSDVINNTVIDDRIWTIQGQVLENSEPPYPLPGVNILIKGTSLGTISDGNGYFTIKAKRGDILDRNGRQLAGEGTASSVGIVPGRMENREDTIKKLAEYLGIGADEIEDKLKAGWVKADSFVPVATIPKIQEVDLLTVNPDKTVLEEKEKQDTLLKIPGIMLSDVKVRTYYLKEAASHLVGYVQAVTAEDLQEHKGEGYRTNSVIGKTGLETLYEKELKGTDGCEICIVDANGNKKSVIAYEPRKDGEDIHTTIDGDLQSTLYEQFKEDRGCSVALNPYTGEVLALVSTPSYDNNDFVRGMDNSQWSALNENEDRPLYNRFRQTWCPGSTFKPVIAAIGLKVGAFTANDDFGNEGLAWQKDSSWGDYTVTTLHDYEPVILKNALIYSDNIYFAKAALKIGADQLMQSLNQIGFNQELPFDIKMSESQYSNMDKIETEIQLADSGYGQGQILVNPLHLASIYTAFLNDGNMIKPYLHADGGSTSSEIWIKDAFSPQIVSEVMEGLEGVVNNPEGTGYGACREDIRLAGKTGTAELKATKEDTSGTEIGWFTVFTTDRDTKNPILLISMVENVKDIGGSGYVVEKDKAILDEYLGNE